MAPRVEDPWDSVVLVAEPRDPAVLVIDPGDPDVLLVDPGDPDVLVDGCFEGDAAGYILLSSST